MTSTHSATASSAAPDRLAEAVRRFQARHEDHQAACSRNVELHDRSRRACDARDRLENELAAAIAADLRRNPPREPDPELVQELREARSECDRLAALATEASARAQQLGELAQACREVLESRGLLRPPARRPALRTPFLGGTDRAEVERRVARHVGDGGQR